jgi:hypothetical protein
MEGVSKSIVTVLSCQPWSGCPVLASLPGYCVLNILSWLSYPGSPVLVVSSWQSPPGCPFLTVLSWLSFPHCPFMGVLSWQSCHNRLSWQSFPDFLSQLSFWCCPMEAVRFWLVAFWQPCPGSPVLAACLPGSPTLADLIWQSCPCSAVLLVLSCQCCSGSPTLPVKYSLSCSHCPFRAALCASCIRPRIVFICWCRSFAYSCIACVRRIKRVWSRGRVKDCKWRGGANIIQDGTVDLCHGTGVDRDLCPCVQDHHPMWGFC